MDPLRTLGSNCVSIGGSVVRVGGGGESINMGVGPVFIGDVSFDCESFVGCPSMSTSALKNKISRIFILRRKYLHEQMIDCGSSCFEGAAVASEVNLGIQHLSFDVAVVPAVDAN
jgi:hypothetical protein